MMTSLRSKWTAGEAVRAGLAVGRRISKWIVTDPAAAGQPSAHFQRNPLGRSQLAVFPFGSCPDSLGPYQFRYGRFARALKNSQLIRPLPDDVTTICETVCCRSPWNDLFKAGSNVLAAISPTRPMAEPVASVIIIRRRRLARKNRSLT